MPKNRNSNRQVVDITTSSSEASTVASPSQSVETSPPLLDELVEKMEQLQSPSRVKARPGPEKREEERVFETETASSSSSPSPSPVPVPVSSSNYEQFKIRIQRLGRKRKAISSSSSSSSSTSGPKSSPSPKWIGKKFTAAVYPPVYPKAIAPPAREGSRRKMQYTMPCWNSSQINPAKKSSESTQILIESSKLKKFSKSTPSSVMEFPVAVKSPPLVKNLRSGTKSKNVVGALSDGNIVKKRTTKTKKTFSLGRDSILQSTSSANISVRNSNISPPTKKPHQPPPPPPSPSKDASNSVLNSRAATTTGRNLIRKRKGSVNDDDKSGDKIKIKKKKKTSKPGLEKAFKIRTATHLLEHENKSTTKKIKVIDISSSDSGFLDSPPPTFKALLSSSPSPSPSPKPLKIRPFKLYYESGSDSEDSPK